MRLVAALAVLWAAVATVGVGAQELDVAGEPARLSTMGPDGDPDSRADSPAMAAAW